MEVNLDLGRVERIVKVQNDINAHKCSQEQMCDWCSYGRQLANVKVVNDMLQATAQFIAETEEIDSRMIYSIFLAGFMLAKAYMEVEELEKSMR